MKNKQTRWLKLYSLLNGNRYFIRGGRRWHLSEFMALPNSISNGWHGSMQLTNTCGMLIKISNCGDAVKIAYVY